MSLQLEVSPSTGCTAGLQHPPVGEAATGVEGMEHRGSELPQPARMSQEDPASCGSPNTYTCACMYIHMLTHAYTRMHIHPCTHAPSHHAYMCACMTTYTCMHIGTYMHASTFNTHVCTCTTRDQQVLGATQTTSSFHPGPYAFSQELRRAHRLVPGLDPEPLHPVFWFAPPPASRLEASASSPAGPRSSPLPF